MAVTAFFSFFLLLLLWAAGWLRRHHYQGPINDADLNAEGVIALAIIFAIEGGGRIVARTGQ